MVHLLHDWVKDIGLWMEDSQLKTNNIKAEAVHFSSSSDTEFAGIARILGFIFDSDLSMKQQVIKTCQAECIKIRQGVPFTNI